MDVSIENFKLRCVRYLCKTFYVPDVFYYMTHFVVYMHWYEMYQAMHLYEIYKDDVHACTKTGSE